MSLRKSARRNCHTDDSTDDGNCGNYEECDFRVKFIDTYIDAVWKKTDYYEHRDHLLTLLEQLDIIARPRSFVTDEIQTKIEDYFFAPCVLKQSPTSEIFDPKVSTKAISTSRLCFSMKNKPLPVAMFNRLLAACLTEWPLAKKDGKDLIFCGCGAFEIDRQHRLTLLFSQDVIQIWVTKFAKSQTTQYMCLKVRKFIEGTLSKIGKQMPAECDFKIWFKCPKIANVRSNIGMFDLEDFFKSDQVACHCHEKTHVLKSDDMLKVWNFEEAICEDKLSETFGSGDDKESPFEGHGSKYRFQEDIGGMPQVKRLEKCIHDGRLKKIKQTWVDSNTKEDPVYKGGYGMIYDSGRNYCLEMNLALKKIDYTTDGKGFEKSAYNGKIAAIVMHWAITPLLGILEVEEITYFMLPLLENGDLYSAIKSGTPILSGYERLKILYQIASAIVYLHTKVKGFRSFIIHGDVTSRNVVIDENKNGRLIHFGRSIALNDGETGRTDTTNTGGENSRVTRNNDWEGFGIVIREMLTNKVESRARNKNQINWNERAKKELAKMTSQCFKSRLIEDIEAFECEVVEGLENLVRTIADNIKWSPPQHKRCVYCMVNPASDNITEHDSKCNMYVCVACLRNSYLNPIHCHTCRQQIVSPVGTKWGAILIAGNDVDTVAVGETFTEEIKKLQEVLISKHPMVNGISKENVYFIHPSKPGKQTDILKEKVIEAFKKLAEKTNDQTVDTVMIYFSGHFSAEKKAFEFGSEEDLFTKEDFEKEIGTFLNIKTVYVFLDCCCAPNIVLPVLDKSVIQLNVSTPLEDTNVQHRIGSPFTRLFIKALIGNPSNISCKETTHGMPLSDGKCYTCEKFFFEDGFITVERMHSYISDHLKNNTPVIYCHGADSKAMKIGYFIESQSKMTFLMQLQNVSQEAWNDDFEIPDTLELLKCSLLLPRFLEKMEIEGSSIPVDKYFDIVAVSVETGPKNTYINELDTKERLISAWNGKRQLYARLRDLNNIRQGRVGIFLNSEIDAEFILKQYLKHKDIRKLYVIKDEDEMIRIEFKSYDMFELDDALENLQLVDQPKCPPFQYLGELVDNLINLPTLDQIDADIVLEFPKMAPEYKAVHKQFFVVSLVKKK